MATTTTTTKTTKSTATGAGGTAAGSTFTAGKVHTFTITKTPRLDKHKKTLQRLIYMQRHIQKGLNDISKRRERHDNVTTPRAGRTWTSRPRMTKFEHPVQGASFKIYVTQQILPDLRSVEKFLSVK